MTRSQFLRELDGIVELPPGSLSGTEMLKDLEMWDSTAVITFLALADRNNGVRIPSSRIAGCKTVADLLGLAQVDVEATVGANDAGRDSGDRVLPA